MIASNLILILVVSNKSPWQSKQEGPLGPTVAFSPPVVALDPVVAIRSEQATEHFAPDPVVLSPVLNETVSLLPRKVKLSGPDLWQNLEEIVKRLVQTQANNTFDFPGKGSPWALCMCSSCFSLQKLGKRPPVMGRRSPSGKGK